MANYENFNSGNYSCKNNYTPSYSGVMNSGFHGSYSGKENYSMESENEFGY